MPPCTSKVHRASALQEPDAAKHPKYPPPPAHLPPPWQGTSFSHTGLPAELPGHSSCSAGRSECDCSPTHPLRPPQDMATLPWCDQPDLLRPHPTAPWSWPDPRYSHHVTHTLPRGLWHSVPLARAQRSSPSHEGVAGWCWPRRARLMEGTGTHPTCWPRAPLTHTQTLELRHINACLFFH